MINIQKTGNAIVVDFTDNDKYLNNGTIEVAPNELMVVIDDSNMATFKKMSNGDTLFGQLIDQIKIQGQSVTKDNIIEKFGTIGFSVSGGGEGGGAVNSVNGQTGDVVITATSLGAITKADADTLYASKSDLNSKANISTVEALSTEVAANRTATTALTSKVNEDSEKIASLNTEMDNKANSADVPTNTQFNNLAGEVANKADKTSVYTKAEADEKFATNVGLNQTLSEYATNVELNHVKAELATKADTSSLNALKSEITGLATKEELANYQPIGDYATTTQLNSKQDTLVSGQNIKTINGQSVIGEGNIDITEGGTIDSELSTVSENPVQNKVITNALNDKASKTELSNVSTSKANKADVYTKQEVDNKLATKQATLIQGTNITLSEPDSEGKVTISATQPDGLATKTELTEGLATKLDTSVYNSEKANFALKSEIPDTSGLATKEEISDMETKTSAAATYQPKGNYAGQQEVTDLTANVTALQANKQDTLVSGTNIKTINGQSLLGEGNIEIQQSELPIASADTLGGVKVGTGLSINPEGVLSADSPEWNNISGKPEDIVNITERLASKLDTATYNSEKSSFATKDELNSKADASAIADMATQTWVQGQGYLTEVPSNYVTNSELTEGLAGKQDKGDYALKSDLNTLATKEELATKADASALSSKQDTLVSGTNIKTINGETILGAGDITIQAGGTIDTAMSDTSENAVQNKVIKKYIDDLVGNILTQLQEINGTN